MYDNATRQTEYYLYIRISCHFLKKTHHISFFCVRVLDLTRQAHPGRAAESDSDSDDVDYAPQHSMADADSASADYESDEGGAEATHVTINSHTLDICFSY